MSAKLVEIILAYKKFILQDLNKLEAIAEPIAKEEYEMFMNGGSSTAYPMTTSPDGKSITVEVFVESRCTVPICFIAFSAIDFFGKMLTNIHLKSEDKSGVSIAKGFAKHAQLFFKYLLDRDDFYNTANVTKFEKKYRHSIMHGYLPTRGDIGYAVAYSYGFFDENTLFSRAWNHEEEILNVKCLTTLVRTGLDKFETILFEDGVIDDMHEIYKKHLLEFS